MDTKKQHRFGRPFPIANLTRMDLIDMKRTNSKGKEVRLFKKSDIKNLTDEEMDRIASKLGDDYIEQMYWISLSIITESFLERKKKL